MPLFDDRTVGALERGMGVIWLKQQAVSHNITNMGTPGYKAKKAEFKDVLRDTTQELKRLTGPVMEEDGDTQARSGGDNVQMEKEELELWKAYTQHLALTMRMSGRLPTLRYMVNNTGKRGSRL